MDIAEGDAYKSIKEALVAAISGAAFGVNSRVKTEIELKRAEENNQQFKEEWIKYSKMQWQSNEDQICFQQKIELEEAIDELWELMQIPKKSYNRVKQVHCGNVWRMKNDEGKNNGALQHKIWKLGRLQPEDNEDNAAYGQQQIRVWHQGKLKMHDQVIMSSFYFGSLMQEHWLSRPSSKCLVRPKGLDISPRRVHCKRCCKSFVNTRSV